jgi:hypothetical protein
MHLMADAYAAAAAWLKMNDDYDNNNPDHSWDGEHDLTLTMAEALLNLAENEGEPLIIVLQGGLVDAVCCAEVIGRHVVVIDYDAEGDGGPTLVPQGKDRQPSPAYVRAEAVTEPHEHINAFAKEFLRD